MIRLLLVAALLCCRGLSLTITQAERNRYAADTPIHPQLAGNAEESSQENSPTNNDIVPIETSQLPPPSVKYHARQLFSPAIRYCQIPSPSMTCCQQCFSGYVLADDGQFCTVDTEDSSVDTNQAAKFVISIPV